MPYSRYVGLTWDGRGKAAVGFDHACRKVFETEIRHQHECYRNFTEAGIRVGHKTAVATAETHYENCLFEGCGRGVLLGSFNVLDHTFDGCEFRLCKVGLFGGAGTNFYVRNSHFERNAEADVLCRGEQGSSIRRCTSRGSAHFLTFGSSVGPLIVQDCHVDAWTGSAEALTLGGAPVLLFDCVFTDSPANQPAVRTTRAEQRLIVSNNRMAGKTPLVRTPVDGKVIEVPAGEQGGVVKSAARSFLKSQVRVAGKVFDVKRDFGAKGDGVADDTAAIAKAIAAARSHGKNAIAYLPTGRYAVSETLRLTGSDYTFGGSGFRCGLVWKGKKGGTTVEVHEPDRVTLENLIVGHHEFPTGDNAVDVLQRGSDKVWVWGMYQKQPEVRGLRLEGLGHRVVAVDQSQVGLAKAQWLAADRGLTIGKVCADLDGYRIEPGAWAGIVSIFCHLPRRIRIPLYAAVAAGLRPGGVLVLEAYAPDQIGRDTGGPRDPDMLAALADLMGELAGLEFLHAREVERDVREGAYHSGVASVVQVIGLRRRADS